MSSGSPCEQANQGRGPARTESCVGHQSAQNPKATAGSDSGWVTGKAAMPSRPRWGRLPPTRQPV